MECLSVDEVDAFEDRSVFTGRSGSGVQSAGVLFGVLGVLSEVEGVDVCVWAVFWGRFWGGSPSVDEEYIQEMDPRAF